MSGSEPAAPRQDLRLVPAALAAWAGMAIATSGVLPLLLGAGAAALIAVVVSAVTRRGWVAAAALVGLATLLAGGWRAATLAQHPLARAAAQRGVVEVTGTVAGEARVRPAAGSKPALAIVPVTVTRVGARGEDATGEVPALVLASGGGAPWQLPVGTVVRFTARAAAPAPGDEVVAVLTPAGPPRETSPPAAPLAVVNAVRAGLRTACAGLPPDQRGLVPALVLGDVSGLDPARQDEFRATALTHLTAVSGSNLTILLGVVLVAARRVGVRGYALRALGGATALVFVVLCRAEPSVLRAAAMGLVGLASLGSGARDGRGLRHLAVAMIGLLAIDPWLARSAGFALSVLASAGIVLLARRWSAALGRWLPGWLADAVAVPLAAQVFTQPLVTAISGQVSVIGLVANAFAEPLVAPATVLGIVATLIATVSPAAAAVAVVPAGWAAQAIVWLASAGAALPGAVWAWPATPAGLAVMAAAAALACLGLGWVLARPALVIALALALVALALRVPLQPGWPPPRWVVAQCDVGQGDALVVATAPGEGILVDVGPDPAAVTRCLDQLGVRRLPLLVLTHDHADHTGGLAGVLATRPVGLVMMAPLATAARPRLLALVAAARVPVRLAAPGERISVGAATWETVAAMTESAAGQGGEGESSAENDGSIVGLIGVAGLRVLVTGDLEPTGQARVLASGLDVRCDVLKVPHHGSGHQHPEFLAATGARVALVSVGAHNDYGHPAPRTLRALEGDGMVPVRTDWQGAVAVAAGAHGPEVTAQHEPRPP